MRVIHNSSARLFDMSEVEVSPKKLIQAAHRFHLRATSVMIFIIYWLMVLTYPDFFIFNPLAETNALRTAALWTCLVGWLVASIGTPTMLWLTSDGNYKALKWIPFTALLWPVSIVFSQLTSYMVTNKSYLNYIIDYPIFILTDIALPVLALWKWYEMKKFIVDTGRSH